MRSALPYTVPFIACYIALAIAAECNLDQTVPPGDLTACGDQSLFQLFRPKARFIAPEGWMNDPMGLFQRSDGTFHAGYQYDSRHVNP
jgi:beta-fructofuranosidase